MVNTPMKNEDENFSGWCGVGGFHLPEGTQGRQATGERDRGHRGGRGSFQAAAPSSASSQRATPLGAKTLAHSTGEKARPRVLKIARRQK